MSEMFSDIAEDFVEEDEVINMAAPMSLSRAKSSSFEADLAAALSAGQVVPLSRIDGEGDEIERLAYAVPRGMIAENARLSRKRHRWRDYRRNSREAAYVAKILRIGIKVGGLTDQNGRDIKFVVVPTTETSPYAEGADLRQEQLQVLHQISGHLSRIGNLMQPPPRN